jgi:thymidylate kinase
MDMSEGAGSASPAPAARIGRTVALIGPDGAGKSTVARKVVDRLPMNAGYLYMGVNLEASPVMLPTTRLALAIKRRRGGRPDMTVGAVQRERRGPGPIVAARRLLRMTNWLAEEAYRAVLARRIRRRPAVVVFDRHFFCDYYAGAVAPGGGPRSLDTRIHGYVLRHWYPRPELTLFLDAPPEVLVARKGEGTVEGVTRRRLEYLELEAVLPAFQVVDVNRPVDEVVDDIVERIVAFVGGTTEAATGVNAQRLPDVAARQPAPAPAPAPAPGVERAATIRRVRPARTAAVEREIGLQSRAESPVVADGTGLSQVDGASAAGA